MHAYRTLIKKASNNQKFGWIRVGVTAAVALLCIIMGVIKMRVEISIMGILFGYISYQNFEILKLSKEFFKVMEQINEQFNKTLG